MSVRVAPTANNMLAFEQARRVFLNMGGGYKLRMETGLLLYYGTFAGFFLVGFWQASMSEDPFTIVDVLFWYLLTAILFSGPYAVYITVCGRNINKFLGFYLRQRLLNTKAAINYVATSKVTVEAESELQSSDQDVGWIGSTGGGGNAKEPHSFWEFSVLDRIGRYEHDKLLGQIDDMDTALDLADTHEPVSLFGVIRLDTPLLWSISTIVISVTAVTLKSVLQGLY